MPANTKTAGPLSTSDTTRPQDPQRHTHTDQNQILFMGTSVDIIPIDTLQKISNTTRHQRDEERSRIVCATCVTSKSGYLAKSSVAPVTVTVSAAAVLSYPLSSARAGSMNTAP